MSLTEIMSAAGLSRYAEVALVLFFLAFIVIVWRIFTPSKQREFDRAAMLPLDEDHRFSPRPRGE